MVFTLTAFSKLFFVHCGKQKKFSTYLNHFSHFLSQRDSGTFCIWIHYLLEVDQNIPTLMSFEQGNSIENECNFPTLDFGLIFAKRDTIALYKMELT